MALYIERPDEVEAFRFGMEPPPYWFIAKGMCNELAAYDVKSAQPIDAPAIRQGPTAMSSALRMVAARLAKRIYVQIKCGDGTWRADYGDYVARRKNGSIFVMKPEQFRDTYREA